MTSPILTIDLVAIGSGLASGLGVLIATSLRSPRQCGECGESLPRFRNRPANRRQLLWGGWSCPNCASELDRRGHRVPATA